MERAKPGAATLLMCGALLQGCVGARAGDDPVDDRARRDDVRGTVVRPLPERVSEPRAPVTGEAPAELVARVREDVIRRSGADPATVRLIRDESVTWSDGSLGCPRPGESTHRPPSPASGSSSTWRGASSTIAATVGGISGCASRCVRLRRQRPEMKRASPARGRPCRVSTRVQSYGLNCNASVLLVAPPVLPARAPLVNSRTPSSSVLPGNRPKSYTSIVPVLLPGMSAVTPK